MGNPYDPVTVNNYNQNPPASDGSEVESNRLEWDTIKNKLPDPLKTAIEEMNTNIVAATAALMGGASVNSQAAGGTVVEGDQGKLIRVTSAGTITTATAATVGAPFVHAILNNSGGVVTVAGAAAETVDALDEIDLPDGSGVILYTDGTNWWTTGRGVIQGRSSYVVQLPRSYLAGLQTSNNSGDAAKDLDIAAGEARGSANAANIVLTGLTKQLDATWAAGTDQGGRSSSVSLSGDTWYHVFAIIVAGAADVGFDTDVNAANLIADHSATAYRRIGSIRTDGSSNILAFKQSGNDFFWDAVPTADLDTATAVTTKTNVAMTVPLGLEVLIYGMGSCNRTTGMVAYVSRTAVAAQSPDASLAPGYTFGGGVAGGGSQFQVLSDTSRQLAYEASVADDILIVTLGWRDSRGRDD